MAIFFFAMSLFQLVYLQQEFHYQAPPYEAQLAEYEKRAFPSVSEQAVEFVKWKTMVVLEQEVMKRRYQQVNAAILTRVWTRYLGFLVGMILALIGAIFILAKLQEQVTKLSAEGQGLRGALETSSPGIVLAVLGTVLVGITLVVPFEFSTRDVPVYTRARDASPSPPSPLPLEESGSMPAKPTSNEKQLFAPRPGTPRDVLPQPSKPR